MSASQAAPSHGRYGISIEETGRVGTLASGIRGAHARLDEAKEATK
ncbi:MAG: hypothetical protein ACWGQW_16575 [bacterium]